tara:strand:+ start:5129 stop:5938 length:810 start_codon:yes stop_codon:yes gene_type:complete
MIIGNLEVTMGADPEKFVHNGEEFVSAHGMIRGTKQEPFVVENGAVQVDGMAVEFNIDPANNRDEFVSNLQSVMGQLNDMIPEFQTLAVPTADFSAEVMRAAPHEAKELGCEPDFNAWLDGAANPTPNGNVSFRTGAGHLHIGWTKDMDINDESHVQACIQLCKQLDLYLGVPSVLFDGDDRRRELYGKAGAMRIKPYGVEYRVLSNAWLKNESLMQWVYDNSVAAISNMLGNGLQATKDVVDVINTSNTSKARELVQYHGIKLPQGVL